jgi:hypothetical protein
VNPRGDPDWRRIIDRLAELREAGEIGADEELELIRHYHATRAALASALDRLLPAYQQRRASEGEERALHWLSEAAEEVGRREGRAARRVLEQLGLDRAVAS